MMWLSLVLACSSAEPNTPAATADADGPRPPPAVMPRRLSGSIIRLDPIPPGQPGARDPEQTRELATALFNDARHGADFAALARRWSTDPTAPRGGELGVFYPGTYAPSVEAALANEQPGGVSPPFRYDSAWLLVQRTAPSEAEVSWWLWRYKGASGASSTRTEASAKAAAAEASAAGGVREVPPDAQREERLGRHQWSPPLDAAVFALAEGETSAPLWTPEGWIVVRRAR